MNNKDMEIVESILKARDNILEKKNQVNGLKKFLVEKNLENDAVSLKIKEMETFLEKHEKELELICQNHGVSSHFEVAKIIKDCFS